MIDYPFLIAQIKQRLSIMDAARLYTTAHLEKKGSSYWCKCLRQYEKTASCQILPDSNRFRCFSCNNRGDQIDFVMAATGLDLKRTVRLLAKDLNLTTEPTDTELAEFKQRQAVLQKQREEKEKEQQFIKQQRDKLIALERINNIILQGITSEEDLDNPDVITALKTKDLIESMLNDMFFIPEMEKEIAEQAEKLNIWE